jgi:hypothetical protein
MNGHSPQDSTPQKHRTVLVALVIILALLPVTGWFVLNLQVVRGNTPSSAAVRGIAFLYPAVDLSDAAWVPDRVARGPNFGHEVHLTAYADGRVIATATVTSFLRFGWQLQD